MTFVDYGNTRPWYPPNTIPIPADAPLTDDERLLVQRMQNQYDLYMPAMYRYNAYYTGEQVIQNLGIAVPPELSSLRTLTGWCRVPIDPLVDRLFVDGFRMPGQREVDPDLEAAWTLNGCDASQSIGFTEALALGRGYVVVSSPIPGMDVPRISFDSPFSMVAIWNPRTLQADAALQSYWDEKVRRATIILPNRTIEMAVPYGTETWQVTNVDEHNWGRVPVHRMVNSPRANQRDGVSEITPELMTVTDAACRTLQNLEVAGQFYSVPQKVILGAAERDFVDASGKQISKWDAYLSSVLALERDETGQAPTITQFSAYNPAVYTQVIEMYASLAAGICGAPPQDFGLYTKGNPTSADAADIADARRDRRARRKQSMFAAGLRGAMQDVLRFMNGGELPAGAERMQVDWADVQMFSVSKMTDAMQKQVAAGIVAPTSEVVQKRLGYTALEREVMAQDIEADKSMEFLRETAHSIMAGVTRDMKILGQGASGKAMEDAQVAPDDTAPGQPAKKSPKPSEVFGGKRKPA